MNYADLFRVTLPETVLEVAALLVLVVDLGFLRKAALKVRVAVAALLGVAGCGVALWAVLLQGREGLSFRDSHELLLTTGGFTAVAQAGILVLMALEDVWGGRFRRCPQAAGRLPDRTAGAPDVLRHEGNRRQRAQWPHGDFCGEGVRKNSPASGRWQAHLRPPCGIRRIRPQIGR